MLFGERSSARQATCRFRTPARTSRASSVFPGCRRRRVRSICLTRLQTPSMPPAFGASAMSSARTARPHGAKLPWSMRWVDAVRSGKTVRWSVASSKPASPAPKTPEPVGSCDTRLPPAARRPAAQGLVSCVTCPRACSCQSMASSRAGARRPPRLDARLRRAGLP